MEGYFFWSAWVTWIVLMVLRWKLDGESFNHYLPRNSWKRAIYFGCLIVSIIVMAVTVVPTFNVEYP